MCGELKSRLDAGFFHARGSDCLPLRKCNPLHLQIASQANEFTK
jgi:hypothetical protein